MNHLTMVGPRKSDFDLLVTSICEMLEMNGQYVDGATRWQSVEVDDKMTPFELPAVALSIWMPYDLEQWQDIVRPNLPWAEEHFQERVSGEPLNPPPSHVRWPYARKNNEQFTANERFSHTYPERFWPKRASDSEGIFATHEGYEGTNSGIRFAYGDLIDVVNLLVSDPYTRQAYLPVWFPEDTGVVHGERVPCSLGYQFLYRNGYIDVIYNIRSCDLFRHFRDDVYMAGRLGQWVAEQMQAGLGSAFQITPLKAGKLHMVIGSLHIFRGDMPRFQAITKGSATCP